MIYNLYIRSKSGPYNIFFLTEPKLKSIVIPAYLEGKSSFTLNGKKYLFDQVSDLKIFRFLSGDQNEIDYYLGNSSYRKKPISGPPYLPPKTLSEMGDDETEKFIGDQEYGCNKPMSKPETNKHHEDFISETRITQLEEISSPKFELLRLIKLCREINQNYRNGNYMTVGMIGRAIIDHVPPIFQLRNFSEVASSYGGAGVNRSFKSSMNNLENSLRNIADKIIHLPIRQKEVLPSSQQVKFQPDLDLLLEEIVRILKK